MLNLWHPKTLLLVQIKKSMSLCCIYSPIKPDPPRHHRVDAFYRIYPPTCPF